MICHGLLQVRRTFVLRISQLRQRVFSPCTMKSWPLLSRGFTSTESARTASSWRAVVLRHAEQLGKGLELCNNNLPVGSSLEMSLGVMSYHCPSPLKHSSKLIFSSCRRSAVRRDVLSESLSALLAIATYSSGATDTPEIKCAESKAGMQSPSHNLRQQVSTKGVCK
jgi:hypothetical protein